MKVVTDVFVHVYPSCPFNEHSSLILAVTDMSEYGYAFIGKTSIEIDVDPFGVLEVQIRQLDAKIAKEKSDCACKINELEATKNSLLTIEN